MSNSLCLLGSIQALVDEAKNINISERKEKRGAGMAKRVIALIAREINHQ